MKDPRHILITGASSGLGAALAEAYAAKGIRLTLLARNAERLAFVAKHCENRGAEVATIACDVTNRDEMAERLLACDEASPIDLLIANAGISGGTSGRKGAGKSESEDQTRAIFATNVEGAMNSVLPLLPVFRLRGAGQIALMSSLASFRGFPGAPAYCASKAAIRIWGEALRADLAQDGVALSVICPGFVKTPMTDKNACPMPFLMEAQKAAKIIKIGLAKGKARIAFPLPLAFLVEFFATLPPALTDRFLAQAPRK
jgi:short-subunit dehydrogenase